MDFSQDSQSFLEVVTSNRRRDGHQLWRTGCGAIAGRHGRVPWVLHSFTRCFWNLTKAIEGLASSV